VQVGVHLSAGRPPRADDLPAGIFHGSGGGSGSSSSAHAHAPAPAGFWGAHEAPGGGDFPRPAAPVVLVFWDPVGPGPSARMPQLLHLARLQVRAP
jgi:hypothetical protein